jgi:DNA-binding response OmpR family regulator
MRTILVVDDEVTIAEAVAVRLRAEGFAVEVSHDGPSAVEACNRIRPDLVVLDLMLPGFDGLEVCRRIQMTRRVPVVMLTARGDETDVLVGLGVGADDYVVKPFSPRQLVARIQAVLRRVEAGVPNDAVGAVAARPLCHGGVELDPNSRLASVDGEVVHLTATEFDLAQWLLQHPSTVFTRGQLLQSVWGYEDSYGERTVDSHIQAIRRKLSPLFVRTVHGVGYGLGRLDPQW